MTKERTILLEGRNHGNYSYPDIFVDPDVTVIYGNVMSMWLTPAGDTPYRSSFEECLGTLSQSRHIMLTPRQFVDLVRDIGEEKSYWSTGEKIGGGERDTLLKRITHKEDTGQTSHEWLNMRFVMRKQGLFALRYELNKEGNLLEESELLSGVYDGNSLIDFDSWIQEAGNNGLPSCERTTLASQNMAYACPTNGGATLYGWLDGVYRLICSNPPGLHAPVRFARLK